MVSDNLKENINNDLVTSVMAAKILGVSRQRIQQMVLNKILPPMYIFNKDSKRKLYVFEKKTVMKFLNSETRKTVEWRDPEESPLLSAPELSQYLGSTAMWIYDATNKGKLIPDLVVGGEGEGEKLLCLYDKDKAKEVWDHRKDPKKTGYRDSTLELIDKIIELHNKGCNDSEIAEITGSKQPLITKLRNEIGLEANTSRGRKSGYLPKTVDLIEKIKMYHSKGLTDTEISKITGKSKVMITKHRKDLGLSQNIKNKKDKAA